MVNDILEVFYKAYSDNGDKLIIDNYQLAEGLYVKVNKNDFECYIVKNIDKQNRLTNLQGGLNYEMYEWFKQRDYYSMWLNANKMFFDKKIHSINYLTFFVKLDSFISENDKKLLKNKSIKYHFFYLCNYKKFKKPQEREILNNYQEYLLNKSRKRDIYKKFKWIKKNIQQIVNIAKENRVKNYIKIFFDENLQKYKNESEIYYALKIFNDISYSKKIEDLIYGLSNSNMGLNSKKPFLEHKNRKLTPPFMIEKSDAILLKKFFDWYKTQDYKEQYPFKNHLYFTKHLENGEVVIDDFDIIPNSDNKLLRPIIIKNYLFLKDKGKLVEDKKIEYLNHLEDLIDEVLYNRQLKYNYFGEVYKQLDNHFANLIYLSRDAMINYFKKYNEVGFFKIIKKYATLLIIEHIKKNRFFLASMSMNIKFSLLAHKGENIMDIIKMQDRVLDKILSNDYTQLNSEEFFYLCGQVAKYLINQSETFEKNGDMLEPYLRANSAKKLKRVIESEYFKYKHKINLGFLKFNNAMSLIMAYDEDEKLSNSNNMDYFLVGALSDNIFYKKSEE